MRGYSDFKGKLVSSGLNTWFKELTLEPGETVGNGLV
jgi:hypothetical protein